MKVVILAGGQGTRLAEQTELKPKPMVEIGGQPIVWHILKHYAHHGYKEFAIALGYRGDDIKRNVGRITESIPYLEKSIPSIGAPQRAAIEELLKGCRQKLAPSVTA
jgi:NDP-sugar pyrophosphorylase family protein